MTQSDTDENTSYESTQSYDSVTSVQPENALNAIRVLSFTSGKGGVGKTQIVSNLACALARRGHRVLLLDGDLGLANIDIMFGVRPQYTIHDVFSKNVSLRDVIIQIRENIDLIPASSGITDMTQLSHMQKLNLMNQIDELEQNYDFLFIDTASGISQDVMDFNAAAQDIVVITTPDPTAITDAYAMIKVLDNTYNEKEIKLLVNQVTGEKQALKVYEKISNVADLFLSVKIDYIGYVPIDKNVPLAIRSRSPLFDSRPSSSACVHIDLLAGRMINMPRTFKGGVQFFWKKLLTSTACTQAVS